MVNKAGLQLDTAPSSGIGRCLLASSATAVVVFALHGTTQSERRAPLLALV
jgi:hypothetical protein